MTNERTVAKRLLKHLLENDCSVSLDLGGCDPEPEVDRSRDMKELMENIDATGEVGVVWFDRDGDRLGTFFLVWGNDPEGSELIADYTDNFLCNQAYNKACVYGR